MKEYQWELPSEEQCSLRYLGCANERLPYNLVLLNTNWMKDNNYKDNQDVLIEAQDSENRKQCCIKQGENIDHNSVKLSKKLIDTFQLDLYPNLEDDTGITLYRIPEEKKIDIETCIIQDITNIASRKISLSKEDWEKLNEDHQWYKIINLVTGTYYLAEKIEFEKDDILKKSEIKLNYLQRSLLGVISQDNPIKFAVTLSIVPLFLQSVNNHKMIVRIRKRISKIQKQIIGKFIGNADILVNSARPFATDETKDIVRLTDSNLKQLGVEEGDRILLSWGPYETSARAFSIGSFELAKETNKIRSESELNKLIGLPACIRRDLQIDDLGITIRAKRDTGFLFKSRISQQMTAILMLLFTVLMTVGTLIQDKLIAVIVALPCCIILTVLLVYIMFSELRNRVPAKSEDGA